LEKEHDTNEGAPLTDSAYAMVFPGQGSQSVGMLVDLAERYPEIERRFREAAAILGYDLWALAQKGPAERLAETRITQPLVFTANIALWDLWSHQMSEAPLLLAGHSLGEYSALVVSGAMSFEAGLRAVMARAEAMANALPNEQGGMLAVLGVPNDQLEAICLSISESSGLTVNCVNYNAPGQTVLGGHKEALDRVAVEAKAAGARKVIPVAMSVPSHSPLMKPAADQLSRYFDNVTFASPTINVIHNATLAAAKEDSAIKKALIEQVYQPVNWIAVVEKIASQGITRIVECGPGKVLTGLNRRINKGLSLYSLGSVPTLEKAMESLEVCQLS